MHIGGYDVSGLIYALIVLIVTLFLVRAHRDPDNPFDLFDLLKINGRVSKVAVAFLTTLFTSSWYVVHEALERQLTDTAFAAYLAAWVAPIVAAILKGDGVSAISAAMSDAPAALPPPSAAVPAPVAVTGGKPPGV
jgi:hypothetical protein